MRSSQTRDIGAQSFFSSGNRSGKEASCAAISSRLKPVPLVVSVSVRIMNPVRVRALRVNAQHRCLEYLKNGIIFLRIGDVMPKSRKLLKL